MSKQKKKRPTTRQLKNDITIIVKEILNLKKYVNDVLTPATISNQHLIEQYVEYKGDVMWKGRQCYHLEFDNKEYGFENYTVKDGEDIMDIASKTFANEYMLLEQNELRSFRAVEAWQKI